MSPTLSMSPSPAVNATEDDEDDVFYNPGVLLPLYCVQVSAPFWQGRLAATRTGALPSMYEQMKTKGSWDVLKLKWRLGDPNRPHRFWDSDVAKWLEAACYALISEPDSKLAALVEEAVDLVRGAQQPDGYINSYYTLVEPEKKWTNVSYSHEMYCAGHLLEAALAHFIYSGSDRLLDPLLRYVRHIGNVFGPGEDKKHGYPGHQELELALLKTYSHLAASDPTLASEHAYLIDLADYFIEERGKAREEGHYFDVEARARGESQGDEGPAPMGEPRFSYHQADDVVRKITSVNGHSVRAMYWLTAVAHLARQKKDVSLQRAVATLWKSTTERKMYISGGLGAIGEWEGFGPDYYLPNESGYLETCASVALAFFARQMLLTQPRVAQYAHILERALYNGVLVGMALDGNSFFYENPLATIGAKRERSEWFDVACCPPNVARLLNSLSQYIYTFTPSDDTLHVHMYISSSLTVTLSSGKTVKVTQAGDGPWGSQTSFLVEAEGKEGLKLALRKPQGSLGFEISLADGRPLSVHTSSQDADIAIISSRNLTNDGLNQFFVRFTTPILTHHPHHLDTTNHGHVAFTRGPFVYAVETIDNLSVSDLRAIRIPDDSKPWERVDKERFAAWNLDEVMAIHIDAVVIENSGTQTNVVLTLIPVCLWANRGRSDVRVWLPRLIV